MLISLLALFWLHNIMPAPFVLIMYGMRNRIMRDYSLDDLRRLAQDFDRLPNLPNQPTPYKTYPNQDLMKTRLPEEYPFLMLFQSPYDSGPDGIAELDGVVYVNGSRAEGGLYFAVSINGKRISPTKVDNQNDESLRLSDDIYFSTNNE